MKYLFLAIFIAASCFHLYFCHEYEHKKRLMTKPLLILSLLLFYVTASAEPSKVLIIALACSWIGDILLMKTSDLWLVAGGAFFIAAHVMLIIHFSGIPFASGIPLLVIALEAALLLYLSFRTIRRLGSSPGKILSGLLFMYLIINSVMNIFALNRLIAHPGPGSALAVFGSINFFLSDCALFLLIYCDDPPYVYRRNFTIMLTYLLAESMIVMSALIGQ